MTLTTFEGVGDNFPNTGVMRITGANNSNVIFTVISNTTVQLEVDEDGDGVVDDTITVPWADLED